MPRWVHTVDPSIIRGRSLTQYTPTKLGMHLIAMKCSSIQSTKSKPSVCMQTNFVASAHKAWLQRWQRVRQRVNYCVRTSSIFNLIHIIRDAANLLRSGYILKDVQSLHPMNEETLSNTKLIQMLMPRRHWRAHTRPIRFVADNKNNNNLYLAGCVLVLQSRVRSTCDGLKDSKLLIQFIPYAGCWIAARHKTFDTITFRFEIITEVRCALHTIANFVATISIRRIISNRKFPHSNSHFPNFAWDKSCCCVASVFRILTMALFDIVSSTNLIIKWNPMRAQNSKHCG